MRTCKECKTPISGHANKKFCGRKCKDAAYVRVVGKRRKCIRCSRPFSDGRGKRRTCSACSNNQSYLADCPTVSDEVHSILVNEYQHGISAEQERIVDAEITRVKAAVRAARQAAIDRGELSTLAHGQGRRPAA